MIPLLMPAIIKRQALCVSAMEGISILAIAAVAIGIATAGIRIFNRLIAARNACSNARSSVDANLAKRHNLIPNLVRVVRAYADHEQQTLKAVTQARTEAMAGMGTAASPAMERALSQTLVMLDARIEAYPELKASTEFARLSRTMTEIEEQISASRRALNAQVMAFNNLVQQLPTGIIARLTGFSSQPFFAAEESAYTAVTARPEIARG